MRGWATTAGKKGRTLCVAVLVAAMLAPACAKKPQKDKFTEHWEARAQKSEGYSPRTHPRRIELDKAAVTSKSAARVAAKPEKKLPTSKVTLRMYNTDLVTVVRALARAAGQNVVLSSSIPGSGGGTEKPLLINVNVDNAPWDETFKSILASNNLVYSMEGDIIRVMTLKDMEEQSKLKEEKRKQEAEKQRTKNTEPFVTYRVEINYSDLTSLQNTIASLCGSTAATPSKREGSASEAGATSREINTSSSATGQGVSPSQLAQQLGKQPGQLICTTVADTHSNSLIIQGPPEDAEKVVQLIEKIDQPRPQVRLKAYIVQATREVANQLGIQWGGKYSGNNFQLTPGTVGQSATTNTSTSSSSSNSKTISNIPIFGGAQSGKGWGVNNPASIIADPTGLAASGTALNFLFGKIGENVLEAQLTTLAAENKVKILSTPTITTMENLPAFVENGQDVPYVSTSQNGTNVQFAHATLKLEMTPHVVDGTNLRMKILVKDDQVDTTNTVQGNPYIYKRETQSNLVVEDGDTIIISGLTRDTVNDTQNGMPYLSNIPLLGWAFKSKSTDVKREDMLIFIIPTILKEKPIAPVPPVAGPAVPPQDMALSPTASQTDSQ